MGRNLGGTCAHDSSLLGSSRRRVFGSALANPIADGNSKARQMAQREKRMLGCSKKLSTANRKYGQLVISRMPYLLEGAQPHLPPVLPNWLAAGHDFRVALSRQVAWDLQTSGTSQQRWSVFLAVGRPCSTCWWPTCTAVRQVQGACR